MVMKAFNKFLVGTFGSRNERVVKSYMQMALAASELEEPTKALSDEQLKVHNCPIEIISHGPIPHRVMKDHNH